MTCDRSKHLSSIHIEYRAQITFQPSFPDVMLTWTRGCPSQFIHQNCHLSSLIEWALMRPKCWLASGWKESFNSFTGDRVWQFHTKKEGVSQPPETSRNQMTGRTPPCSHILFLTSIPVVVVVHRVTLSTQAWLKWTLVWLAFTLRCSTNAENKPTNQPTNTFEMDGWKKRN